MINRRPYLGSYEQNSAVLFNSGFPFPHLIKSSSTRRSGIAYDDVRGSFRRALAFVPSRCLVDAFRGFSARREGRPPEWATFTETYVQRYRVADSQYDVFELYVGEDQSPDFDASSQPVATSASLPITWTPSLPASGVEKTLHIVLRKRNKYNLSSFNVFERFLVIDSVGAAQNSPVTAPTLLSVIRNEAGYAKVNALYNRDDDPADTWEVYAEVGVDPIPGTDTPVYSGTMRVFDDRSALTRKIGPFSAGGVIHVIVSAVRSSDGERASSSVVQYTIPASLDIEEADLFGGSAYEQR